MSKLMYHCCQQDLTSLLNRLASHFTIQSLNEYKIQGTYYHEVLMYWFPLVRIEFGELVDECQIEIVLDSRSESTVAELSTSEGSFFETTAFALVYRLASQIAGEYWDELTALNSDSSPEVAQAVAALIDDRLRMVDRESAERLSARLRRECILLDYGSDVCNVSESPPTQRTAQSPSKPTDEQVQRVRDVMASLESNPTKNAVKNALRSGGQKAFRDILIGKAIDIVNSEHK